MVGGHLGCQLDPQVGRPGMQDEGIVGQAGGPAGIQAEVGRVLPDGGDEALGDPLALEPQQVAGVQVRQRGVEVVGDGDRPTLCRGRQQRRRGDEQHLGSEQGEGQDVGPGDP